jgi:hypothetical protein
MEIDKYIAKKDMENAIRECLSSKRYYLGIILCKLWGRDSSQFEEAVKTHNPLGFSEGGLTNSQKVTNFPSNPIKIKLLSNFATSEQLANLWNKMSKGNYTWNTIKVVWSDPVDYYVIINRPPENVYFDKKKTIVFQMEPYMSKKVNQWGEWANPDSAEFLKVFKHTTDYNNNEWHLSLTYNQLVHDRIDKNPLFYNTLSTVLSGQYSDIGHTKRIDFIKFLETRMDVHVYGNNRWDYKQYKGSLPYHCKDAGILPYKYTFNGENNSIPNYYTEKLIDGILGECLTFYWGCPNVRELIDPRAYIQLELSNFENDFKIIQQAIREDWHTARLPYIREAKNYILNNTQFFPRLENLLSKHVSTSN